MVNALLPRKGNMQSTQRVVVLLSPAEIAIVDTVSEQMGFRSRSEALRQLIRDRRDQARPEATKATTE
jgi:metal-responsive CopG/Arc/MetJ family transcriptional regulator